MNDFVELRQYVTAIRRRWWLILLGALLGAALGYGISQKLPIVFEATASLMVGQSIQATDLNSQDIQTSERLALTYAEIAERQPVLQGAVEALELPVHWQQLRRQVEVKPVVGTQLLEVTAEAASPEGAQLLANEIARQIILLSPTSPQLDEAGQESILFVRERLSSLESRIQNAQARIVELESVMATATTATGMEVLQDEVNTLEGLITDWENNYAGLLSVVKEEKSANYLAIIEMAQLDPNPVRPVVQLNVLLASVVGLFLALGLVVMLEYLDDSIKSTDDVGRILNLTPLGAVVQMSGRNVQDKLIPSQGVFSPVSETYRMIRTNLHFMSVDKACRTIMITSAVPGEGKSVTVANLGIVMAHAGLETIIVDTDLRRPTQQRLFQLYNQGGLTDLIRWPELDVADHLSKTKIERLRVLTSGAMPPNPSEILGSKQMERLLERLKEVADVVILDTPPAASVTDAAVLSNKVDGVVLVVKAGQSRRDLVKTTVSNLQQTGATLLGTVLNGVSNRRVPGYYSSYYSGYDEPVGLPFYRRFVKRRRQSPPFDLPEFGKKPGVIQMESSPHDINA